MSRHRTRIVAPRKRNEGVALVLALVFVVLLTVLVVEFLYESEVEASFAANQGSDFQAYIAAKSAVYDGMAQLQEHIINIESGQGGDDPLNPSLGFQYDSLWDSWAIGRPFEPLNEATMRTSISDEFGKINLNALLLPADGDEPQVNEPLVAALTAFFMNRLSVDDESTPEVLVNAILDWLDYGDDDNERPDGAENDYYLGLENPYPCKNGPMDSIEELLLIKGFTPEFYFGDPKTEPPQMPLHEYLTVHGDWAGAVNVNTAPYEVLASIGEGWRSMGVDVNYEDLDYQRQELGGFRSPEELSSFVSFGRNNDPDNPDDPNDPASGQNQQLNAAQGANQAELRRIYTIHSNAFRIHGDGQEGDILVRVEAYVWRYPLDPDSAIAVPDSPAITQEDVPLPEEDFRILDWKVIR